MASDEVVEVEIRVLHANGLKVADTYSSDPYVVLSFGSKKVGKTKRKKKTLDPIWDETFTLKWKKTDELTLNVYDSDLLTDDFLGVVTVRYSDARISAGRSRTYKLFPRSKKDKGISGSIYVLFSFGSYADDPMLGQIGKVTKQKGDKCKLRILSAENLKESEILGGKVDPYAVLKCGNFQKRTHIADSAQDPVWDFETEIEWHKDAPLVIEIRDFDFLSSYDFLGFCRISNEKAHSFGGKRKVVGLEERSENDEGITGVVTVQFLFEGMKDEPLKREKSVCMGGIFGMSLEEISSKTNELIPNIVSDAIRFLIRSGLDRCGIFRLCGDLGEVQKLKKKYASPHTSLDLEKEVGGEGGGGGEGVVGVGDSHDSVASLLKRFFFELPIPLIDFGSFDRMLDAHGEYTEDENEEKFDAKLTEIVTKMEKIHLYPFIIMAHFLNQVASYSETNLMPLTNLAVCFGPTFSRTEEIRQDILVEQLDRKIVERLLTIYPRWNEALSQEDKDYLKKFKQEMESK